MYTTTLGFTLVQRYSGTERDKKEGKINCMATGYRD